MVPAWHRVQVAQVFAVDCFSTVRMADRILFLEHGRLVEQGNPDELKFLLRPIRHA